MTTDLENIKSTLSSIAKGERDADREDRIDKRMR